MSSRAMIVVAGGSATRFGGDKVTADVGGRPLIAHAIEAVSGAVDTTVVAARADLVEGIRALGLDVIVTTGGSTRTDSEFAGLAALGREFDLIGIHDAARPLVARELVDLLFDTAEEVGGAVPTLPPAGILVGRRTLQPVTNAVAVQTPQVFRGPALLAAYVGAARAGFEGHDTVEVMQRFGDVAIAAVEGDPMNIKVTYPEDLETVRIRLGVPSRNEPR